MSNSIEEQVVSIKFDNAKFEANVRTTLTTLDGLKKSLDFSSGVRALNELDNAGKKINAPKFDNTAFNASVKNTVDSANELKKNLKFDGVTKGLTDLDAAGKKVNLNLDPTGFQNGAKGIVDAANAIKQNLNFASVQAGLGNLKGSVQNFNMQSVVTGFNNAKQAIGEMDLAGKAVNFSSIGMSAGEAQQSISAMSIAGIAALGALAFKAASVGMEMAKKLFVDPAQSGLAEYETNLNSIQTILANTQSKGSTITDVNASLEELNAYSDQTIYNFGEMAKAIGTFTTAGVDLDTSTASIKGLSNVAAMSGANSTQAASAMEQLSRALSAGKVGLQDWMSIETAGMASESFRESLMETARAQGEAVDSAIEKNGSFRLSLQEGWLTTDVMTATLQKFTGDLSDAQLAQQGYNEAEIADIQRMASTAKDAATKVKTFTQLMGTLNETSGSGWAKSAQLVLGDFEQAKEMWTNVNNVLGGMLSASADSRNKLLGDWNALGGRDRMISAVTHAFSALMEILTPVQQAFREVFPPTTGQQLFDLTEAINHFMWLLRPSTEQVNLIHGAFKLLFTIIKIGVDIFKGAIGVIYAFFKAFATGGDSISGSLKPLTDSLAEVTRRIQESKIVEKFFAALTVAATTMGNALRTAVGFVTNVALAIWDIVDAFIGAYYWMNIIPAGLDLLKEYFENFGITIQGVLEWVDNLGVTFRKMVRAFLEGGLSDAIDVFYDSLDAMGNIGDAALTRITERMESIQRFAERLGNAWDQLMAGFSRLWDKMLPLRQAVVDLFSGMADQIKAAFTDVNYDDTLDMVNTGLLAGLVLLFRNTFKKMLGMGDGVKEGLLKNLDTSVESINGVLESLSGTLEAMQQNLKADTLTKIAIAIGIMALSVIALSLIDSADLTKALISIGVMVVILTKAMEALDKITMGSGFLKLPFIAASMILLATALAILVIPVTQLSQLSWTELLKGLLGVSVLLKVLSKTVESMAKNPADLIATGAGLMIIAVAVRILASAVATMGALSLGDLIKGLAGVSIVLFALSKTVDSMAKNPADLIATGIGLMAVAVAVKILASAVSDFGTMDLGTIIQGIVAMGIVLKLLEGFTKGVGDTKNIIQTATAMVILGVAMKIIASAMSDFASMTWEETAKGLLIMTIALKTMSQALARVPQNMFTSALGFVAVAVALKILASALKDFATMSWEDIGKAMTVLAGSLILISVALIAMQGTLSGAAALIVVSAALFILAQALTVFGNLSWEQMLHGFAALAGVFVIFGLAGLILAPLVPVLFALGMSILMLGGGLAGIGLGTVLFAAGLVAIGAAVAVAGPMLIAFIGSILALIPLAMVELGKGIVQFAEVIGNAMPVFLKSFVALLTTLLTAVQMVWPQLMDVLWLLITSLVDLVVRGVPLFVDAGFKLLIGILKGIGDNIGELVDAAYKVVVEFIDGIARNLPKIIDSGINLIVSFVQGLADGVREHSKEMSDAGWDLAEAIVSGMVNGIADGVNRVVEGAKNLAGNVWEAAMKALDAHSPSRKFVKLGGWTAEGLAIGIHNNSHMAEKASTQMGYAAVESLKKAMSGVNDLAPDGDLVPTIRPVLDLSAVRKDAALIPGMFTPPSLQVGSSYNKAATLSVTERMQKEAMAIEIESANTPPVIEQNISYVQNNTSPKALSRVEIYRDTKNHLSTIKKGELVDV